MVRIGLLSLKSKNSTCCKLFYFTGQPGQKVLKDIVPLRYLVATGPATISNTGLQPLA